MPVNHPCLEAPDNAKCNMWEQHIIAAKGLEHSIRVGVQHARPTKWVSFVLGLLMLIYRLPTLKCSYLAVHTGPVTAKCVRRFFIAIIMLNPHRNLVSVIDK